MKTSIIFPQTAAAITLLATMVMPVNGAEQAGRTGLTSTETAANGPLPGDVSLYGKEFACAQKLSTPGYYASLNAAEIADAQRSGLFPCATFTGSFEGPNQVFAWRSADDYPGISYINNRRPGELYIVGGEYPTRTIRCRPGRSSPKPMRPPAGSSGAPTSTTPMPPVTGSATPT